MEERVFSFPAIRAALRRFVCVRLDGRESAENAALKVQYGPVVRGNVQNRIVSPEGENLVALPTHFEPARLARYLERWADVYERRRAAGGPPEAPVHPVPYLSNLHHALNVAACDSRPLVVVLATTGPDVVALERIVSPLFLEPAFAGRFHFVRSEPSDPALSRVQGVRDQPDPAIHFVAPNEFGLHGRVIRSLPVSARPPTVRQAARAAIAEFAQTYVPRTVVEKFQLHAEVGEGSWYHPIAPK